jgi:hypothetical protein
MKKIIWASGLVLLVAAIIVLWPKNAGIKTNNNLALTNDQNQQEQQKALRVSVSTSTVSQKDSFYNIQGSYPQFTLADETFNKKISDLVLGKIETFKKDAKDAWEARKATAAPGEAVFDNPETPFDFIANWTQTRFDEKYISFSLTIYYFSGGAHGLTEVDGFNYDIMNKKEITMNEFLGNSSRNLEELSQLAKRQVVLQLQSNGLQIDSFLEQMVNDGTKPVLDNYENFNFNKDSLIIYFQQYQVAPGSAGQVTITFDKNTLEENSIKSDYLK